MAKLIDVARLANVSVSTASKVLGQGKESGRIGAEAAQRVREAAQRLEYRPNYHARSLLSGHSLTLGFVISSWLQQNLGDSFWSRTVGGVGGRASRAGYDFLVIGPSPGEADELQRGLRFLREGRIDALVAGGFLPSVRNGAELHDLEEKIVLAEYYRPTRLPVVQLDPAPGVAAGVRHLAELGHREILWTSWRSRGQEVAPERREAFEQEAQARGLKARVVTFEQQDDAAATRAGFIEFSQRRWAEYLRREPLPTAVFAYNELNGLGLYAALAERGLRVPRDVSVIGWDRLHDDLAVPAMTTVSLMLGEIGARAAELAIELAEGTRTVAELRGARERVPAELAVSASTAPPRA